MSFIGYWHCSLQYFKQRERYTFYGFVVAITKQVPNLGKETRVLKNAPRGLQDRSDSNYAVAAERPTWQQHPS